MPQGSVLGPLLWNIAYDGLLRIPRSEHVKLVAFADDLAVIAYHREAVELEECINRTLMDITEWLAQRGLELAIHKTEAIILTARKWRAGERPPIVKIQNQQIPYKDTLKYLGLNVGEGPNFKNHLKTSTQKSLNVIFALSKLMPNVGGPRSTINRRLMSAVALGRFLYGAPIWDYTLNCAAYNNRCEKVRRQVMLRVSAGYRTTPSAALGVITGIPPIRLLTSERREIYQGLQGRRQLAATIRQEARADMARGMGPETNRQMDLPFNPGHQILVSAQTRRCLVHQSPRPSRDMVVLLRTSADFGK